MTVMAGESNVDDVRQINKTTATAMFLSSAIFKVYGSPNLETQVSKLSQSFPVANMIREAIHVQFPTRKLVFRIIPIACEGSRRPEMGASDKGDWLFLNMRS